MNADFSVVLLVAGLAALASVAGGAAALWHGPAPFVMSLTFGFAAGVLLGAIGLDLLPRALDLGGLPVAAGGFVAGFGAIYSLDLFVHRGQPATSQRRTRKFAGSTVNADRGEAKRPFWQAAR